ncbi:aminotransferase class V-fold PLP-dependent enzyme [Patulibacter defluvii]|uniref:aminotransferase class V-fold PLP-dependent enzyme n=1 Tax=Patulibacter defluvii TaxID=3095358 RepID=UPI002A7545A3|nr:aminotransferase class V-fold PLP-dependent enzyme [Patulibacter sp. DM4]
MSSTLAPSTARPRAATPTGTPAPAPTAAAPATAPPTAAPATAPPTAEQPLLPVVGADLAVPLLGGGRVRYVGLDYAATAPALRTVADRIERLLPFTGSVHRGAGLPSQASSAAYEAARRTVHEAVGGRPEDVVVFTRNTTDATNLLARSVPPAAGDVITLDIEHHATLLPWRSTGHRCVPHAPTIEQTLERLALALRTRRAALLAVTAASNVTGELLPLDRIVALAHEHGTRVLIDGAQLLAHRTIDLSTLHADYLAFSGHKLYAPYGAGVLVGRRDWLDAAPPYLAGGGAVRDVTLDGTVWAEAPARHEAGTPNLLGAVAIAEALRTLAASDGIAAHEETLRRRLVDGLAGLDGVRPLRIWRDAPDAIGVVAFTVDGFAPGHVGAFLSAEHGIGIRDGRFCAHPLLARLGLPEGALRASFGVGSRAADVDRLVEAVRCLTTVGPRHRYAAGPAGWAPVDDDRDLDGWLAGTADAVAELPPSPCATG